MFQHTIAIGMEILISAPSLFFQPNAAGTVPYTAPRSREVGRIQRFTQTQHVKNKKQQQKNANSTNYFSFICLYLFLHYYHQNSQVEDMLRAPSGEAQWLTELHLSHCTADGAKTS